MVYVENVFVCIAMPMILLLLLLKGEAKRLNIFLVIGMTVCLFSGYFNSFFREIFDMPTKDATVLVTPIVEEILKALPIMFYALTFAKKPNDIITAALSVGIGFAILENACYITRYGSADIILAVMRGFATGVMHGICTAIVGYGLTYVKTKKKLAVTGVFGLLCAAVTYHAIFNMLVTSSDLNKYIGCAIPALTLAIILAVRRVRKSLANAA